ncbi:hypothetical protein [Corynebacterium callunae]|uniref:hypothetical protein n=1 Tax=Corynebacterium callunae TaxID=1721 RepID=UPI001FFEDC15|nr:hypothetical protein [Corynebacterium callunae]MCK2200211.1 hypothetical protein [Corynebacterium callunae]
MEWLISYEASFVLSPGLYPASRCWCGDVVFLWAGDFVIDPKSIALRLSPTERKELLSLAGSRQVKKPKISTEVLSTFERSGLVIRDEYGSLVISDEGSAVLRYVESGR